MQDAFSSSFRVRRDASFISNKTTEIENLIKKIMDSMDLLKDDVMSIRNDVTDIKDKLDKIDENLAAKRTSSSDVAISDMYMLDELNPNNYLGANLYDPRNQTPVAGTSAMQQQQTQQAMAQQAVYNQMFNTPYPMYQMTPQNALNQQLRNQAKLPGLASPMNYGNALNDFQASMMMAQQNGYFPQLGVYPATPQQQQQPPPSVNINAATPKSALLEALSTPSLLSTWNNTYNQQTPQTIQQQVPPPVQQQPHVSITALAPAEKQPPVNVVITSSDPLPTQSTTISQPTLSVTIPPQHIKHPQLVPPTMVTIPASAAVEKPKVAQFENVTPPNKSSNNEDSLVEPDDYDPCPNFQPIIPLPDEIEVKTGEENEEEMLCERAKLFRFVEKEWKERGIGQIKILKNPQDHKVRILMRREQIHKICANHQITADLKINAANDKSFIWMAPDFSENEMVVEKFLLRFKNAEMAKRFQEKFEEAKKYVAEEQQKTTKEPEKPAAAFSFGVGDKKGISFGTPDSAAASKSITTFGSTPTKVPPPQDNSTQQLKFGSSTPIQSIPGNYSTPTGSLFSFKPKEPAKEETKEAPKPSPFANFTFGNTSLDTVSKPFQNLFNNSGGLLSNTTTPPTNTTAQETLNKSANDSQEVEEYEPNVTFEPVIPLPELVEAKTGEENENILFEHRAKLLRYDSSTKEWKERGIGNMKVLVDKNDSSKARLLMRREQVFKLCCNQLITQELKFTKLPKSETALSWYGPDFSENEMKTEMLAIRFKTADLCQEFHNAVLKVQENLKSGAGPNKEEKKEKEAPAKGFGDQFKAKAGSWDCQACYINNKPDVLYCVACETPKDDTVPKKESKGLLGSTTTTSKFSFGMPATASVAASTTSYSELPKFSFGSFGTASQATTPFGNTTATVSSTTSSSSATKEAPAKGFGDQFKPKTGSWDCKACYINNKPDVLYCVACESPKDDTVPKKEPKSLLETTGNKFSFGMPATAATTTTEAPKFGFGVTQQGTTAPSTGFTFGSAAPSTMSFGNLAPTTTAASSGFTFGAASSATPSASVPSTTSTFSFKSLTSAVSSDSGTATQNDSAPFAFATPPKSDNSQKDTFNFVFKPKSPKSPGRSANNSVSEDHHSDNEYHEEEENNTYFTPVIPLPDKVDVKTGEEDEDVLYSHRAKLFRFVDNEWKERGLGEVKILRHQASGKLR